VNANRWKEKITEVVPVILARADVTASVARVFISYRRLETLPIALQLFDRLTHEGLRFFSIGSRSPRVTTFSGDSDRELEDKSMVLLLESKRAKHSKWTQHQIDFATN